ncbi:MAG: hypothetical protein HOQ45_22760 [Nocardioidaceae bacterium]|nr:hypothetical protein [Nocardioidaceae bacterium]
MTATPHSLRRPPAPTGHLATVTRLGPPGGLPEVVPVATVQGTLALDLDGLPPAPAAPELRVVRDDEPPGYHEVRAWAARVSQAAVEFVGGDRPVAQLLRWTNARVYQDLDRRVRILARTARAPQRRRTIRPQVRSVHVFQPRPDCAEVSVHVRHGHRSRALAARLELRRGRWTCVALQLG